MIETGKTKTAYEEPQYCEGKKTKWLLTSKQPLRHNNQIVGVVGTYDDIAERRAASFLQEKKSKLEAIGRMAAGVAHDVNNLLVPITLSADLVNSQLPNNAM